MVMPYHLHMPSYFLETFTEYPCIICGGKTFYVRLMRIEMRERNFFTITTCYF